METAQGSGFRPEADDNPAGSVLPDLFDPILLAAWHDAEGSHAPNMARKPPWRQHTSTKRVNRNLFRHPPRLPRTAVSPRPLSEGTAGYTARRGTLAPNFLTGPSAAVGIAFINSVAALGAFVAPWLIGLLKDATGSYSYGLLMLAALVVAGGCWFLVLE